MKFFLLAVCVSAGAASQALAGFGGVIVALTLGALIYGDVTSVLPLIVPMTLLTTSAVVARHHRTIEWRVLLTVILPLMAIGAAAGFAVLESGLDPNRLMQSYGVLVAVLAARALWKVHRAGGRDLPADALLDDGTGDAVDEVILAPAAERRGRIEASGWVLAAGFVQGLFASGGPLLVMAASRLGFDKGSFRSTLCTVWLVLNPFLVFGYVRTGRLTADMVPSLLLLVPAIGVGIVLGELGHERVSERAFRVVVNTVLLGSGLAILFR